MNFFATGRSRRAYSSYSPSAWPVAVIARPAAPPGPGTGPSSGKSTPAGKSGPRLMFITNGTSDWWNAVEKGMRDGAKDSGLMSR